MNSKLLFHITAPGIETLERLFEPKMADNLKIIEDCAGKSTEIRRIEIEPAQILRRVFSKSRDNATKLEAMPKARRSRTA